MNILFCINKDIFSNLAINYLIDIFKNHSCFITMSQGVAKSNPALENLLFIENTLPYKILFPLKISTHKKHLDFDSFIKKYNVTYLDIANINSKDSHNILTSLKLDLIISIRYGQIFKNNSLTIAKHGILNLHSGKLPQYRGIMATFWSMLHHEKTLGTTLHYINDNNIDTGDIIDIKYIDFQKDKSFFWHLGKLYIKGCDTLLKTVQNINNNAIPNTTKPINSGNYYSTPTIQDITKFYQSGYKLYEAEDIQQILKNFF